MPIETITLTIPSTGGNANPQTAQVQVTVDPVAGTGTGSFTYTGTNAGIDSIQASATLAGTLYTSNIAQINWQSSNGQIQIGNPVTVYMWNDSNTSSAVDNYTKFNTTDTVAYAACTVAAKAYLSTTGSAYQGSATGTSLVFDPAGGSANPVNWETLSAAGVVGTAQTIFAATTENFNMVVVGTLLVPPSAVGIPQTLTAVYKDSIMWGIGGSGASWAGKGTLTGQLGQTMTAMNGYPLLPAPQVSTGSAQAIGANSVSVQVTFAEAGEYSIEGNWDYWYHSGRTFQITAGGATICPVILATPPPVTTASGNLTLTPTGGPSNLVIQGESLAAVGASLTISVSGIVYTSVPYLPVLEGTAGEVYISNDPSSLIFAYPYQFNGESVPTAAALSAGVISLSGSNGVWNGLLALAVDGGGHLALVYNGGAFTLGGQASTELTVVLDDVAWYSAVKGFDLFQESSQGGGSSAQIQVNYLVVPTIGSVTSPTLTANGSSYPFTLTLSQSLPPVQSNAILTVTGSNGLTVGTATPTLDVNGWVSGWSFNVTVPSLPSSTSATLTATLVGPSVTYLSGSSIVTGDVTYINAASVPLSLIGNGVFPSFPTEYAWNVNTSGTTVTLTATVKASTNSFGNCQFLMAGLYPNTNPTAPGFSGLGASVAPTSVTNTGAFWYASYSLTTTVTSLGEVIVGGGSPFTLVAQFGFEETNTDGSTVVYHDTYVYS